jgi:formate dehydrogenase subunit beta
MNKSTGMTDKGAVIPVKKNLQNSIKELLKKAMEKGVFDAVILPMKVPSDDSFVYVLIKDKNLLEDATPISPVMSVQGAKVISSVTRLGEGNMKIAAIMRPCEIRATIELTKLDQTNIENITLISMDCPGVMPISDFIKEPEKAMKSFETAVKNSDDKIMRPVCQICDKSSMISGDLHIGTHGAKKDTFLILSNSDKGTQVLDQLGIKLKDNIESWKSKVKQISDEKSKKRNAAHKNLKTKINGLDNIIETFSQCINCHNCMRVCPVCYCRLCYFEFDNVKHPSAEYLCYWDGHSTCIFT